MYPGTDTQAGVPQVTRAAALREAEKCSVCPQVARESWADFKCHLLPDFSSPC